MDCNITLQIRAIHPNDTEHQIRPAFLKLNYFSKGNHAINFGGINTSNYCSKEVPYEFINEIDQITYDKFGH